MRDAGIRNQNVEALADNRASPLREQGRPSARRRSAAIFSAVPPACRMSATTASAASALLP
jgi:hypothetical protein